MLKLIYDSVDDIPDGYKDLYTEKSGKWHFTAIAGIKTQDDINNVQRALDNEKAEHAKTKEKLAAWGDLDPEKTQGQLDKIPELEAAAQGALEKAQIDEIVERRVEATINTRTAPLERQITTLTGERDALGEENTTLKADRTQRQIHDVTREAMTKLKVIPEAHEDVLMYSDRIFEVLDDGNIVTRDNVGVTPGISPEVWLTDMQQSRPHWWPASQGGGAPGAGAGRSLGDNPWSHGGWNLTKQAQMIRDDPNKAEQMAKAAGVAKIGGRRPEK